jgi:hypothetical protein
MVVAKRDFPQRRNPTTLADVRIVRNGRHAANGRRETRLPAGEVAIADHAR